MIIIVRFSCVRENRMLIFEVIGKIGENEMYRDIMLKYNHNHAEFKIAFLGCISMPCIAIQMNRSYISVNKLHI